MPVTRRKYVRWFDKLRVRDVATVGGKNASLGELVGRLKTAGVRVPNGFATTAEAYWMFIDSNDLRGTIKSLLVDLSKGRKTLQETGGAIRGLLLKAELPDDLADAVRAAYRELSQQYGSDETDVAVRSSATAEDLPGASFAGQHETFLNVCGEDDLMEACRRCYASLFTDRAINYRDQQGFEHMKVALSIGVQKMVRSDRASAGVMFSIDTETGFPHAVIINAAWGLGETVVQGQVTPDEYIVFKPALADPEYAPILEKEIGDKRRKLVYGTRGAKTTRLVSVAPGERKAPVLNDEEIVQLARWASAIEEHYGVPMDVEWAKDGDSGDLYIVQARPETVQSRKESAELKTYALKQRGKRLLKGLAIGDAIASGEVSVILDVREIERFEPGSILVTGATNPDWVPIMKQAAGLVTDHGGRTSHAAIVSRELGLPAVVGTGNATAALRDGQPVTISCAEGEDGYVYEGELAFKTHEERLDNLPDTRVQMMINLANPVAAFRWWRLPARGIGLARMEFIIDNIIKIHPMALVRFDALKDRKAKRQIERLAAGYEDKREYFVERLARGVARIAASQHPDPVIVRMSDFKTNEYADLIGGREFEPHEENPMIGFRGACRYYSESYKEGFGLECRAIKRAREEIGLTNIVVMIPFCRTVEEGRRVLSVMEEHGLRRGENGLEVYVMAEIPSNVILAEEFAEIFDGFSIGSNDLTQLVLGVDRDSADLSYLFEERNEAIKRMIAELIEKAHRAGRKVGICGQAPSDHPDFAAWLAQQHIDSMSLNPDSVVKVVSVVAEAERSSKKR